MLKALIAGDDFLVRAGIAASIAEADLDIVLTGETDDRGETLELCRMYDPELLLLDGHMQGSLALLQEILGESPERTVILLAESDETAAAARRAGASEVLVRPASRKEDLIAALKRAAEKEKGGEGLAADMADIGQTGVWREFLFGKGCSRLPFRAMAITAVRLFQNGRENKRMQQSLDEMMLRKTGCMGAFIHFQQSGCRILVWKEPPEKYISETTFTEGITEAMRSFHVQVGYAVIPEVTNGILLPAATRALIAVLQDPRLFDDPVVVLDEDGRYIHKRLDDLRHEFAVNQPFCRQNREFMELKEMLDRYPEAVTKGLNAVVLRARPLLRMLGIRKTPGGLAELTGRICEKAEIRLREIIPAFRPQIRKVMETIRTRLPEHISREELSQTINYDSAYFSRLFKQETGMNYIDYLFEMRMLCAMDRVGHTDEAFTDIAREVGFPNISYFFRRFRQFCGMTPGEWREQVIKRT